MRKLLFLPIFIVLVFYISSCSVTEDNEKYSASDPTLSFPYSPSITNNTANKQTHKVFPWEIWNPGKDMDGLPLTNFNITSGDDLNRSGNRIEALKKYQAALKTRLLPQEEESVIFRLASTQLALQKTQDALNVLSDYFTKKNESVNYVSPAFCILLGYAYGFNQNIEQSLAWFSRVNKLNPPDRNLILISSNGAKDFLSRVPAANFDQTASMWASDDYIRNLIAEERALRASRGVAGPDTQFSTTTTAIGVPGVDAGLKYSGVVNIGVMLPLSGKYAVLGNNTKNGLEFALAGKHITDKQQENLRLELVIKDVGSTAGAATPSLISELVASANPSLIIGPLLSEEAVPAAEAARQARLPMITFSKKNTFLPGGGVFRLGATPQSQVESILSKTFDELRITQYALVYSNDANGLEFAESYRRELANRNTKPQIERSYNREDMGALVSIAQELEQSNVQAVLFPDNLLSASRLFSNVNPKKLESMKILGTASWDDAAQLARYNTIMNGAIFVSPFFSGSEEDNIKNFVTLYKEKYKSSPDFLAAQGYDTGVLVLNAFNTAYASGAPFADSLSRFSQYSGLTGRISVSPSGEINRKFRIVEFRDGVIKDFLSLSSANYIMKGNEPVTTGTPLN